MRNVRGLAVAAVICALCAGLALSGAAAAAGNKGHRLLVLRVAYPKLVVAGKGTNVRGKIPRSVHVTYVALQRQPGTGGSWRFLARGRVKHRRFVVSFRAPKVTGTMKLRVIAGASRHPAAQSHTFLLPVTETTVLRPAAVVSAPAPGRSGTIVYDTSNKPTTGGFLAIGVGKATPDGLLVKIVHVSGRAGHWVLAVQPASLFDAIPSGQIQLNPSTLGTARLPSSRSARGVMRPHLALDCSAGASAQASASASLSLKPSLDLSWGWDWYPPHAVLKSAQFSMTAAGTLDASASLSGSGACSVEHQLFQHDFSPFDVQIGPVPVVIVPQLDAKMTASASASASISTSANASISATGGVSYNNGKVSPIDAFSRNFSFQSPSPQGKGSVGAQLEPAGRLLIYGIAGPEVDLSGGPQFDVDTTSSSLWRLHIPVDLSASLVVPHTSVHLGPLDVYNHDFTLAQGSTTPPPPPPPPASVSLDNPGDQTGTVGTYVDLPLTASDSDGGTLSYAATGLPDGLSIDPGSGDIYGNPTTQGDYSVTVTATDASGPSASASFNWSIAAPPPALTTFYSADLNGGYVAAGVGMRNLGYGHISIAGIPSGSTVARAFLLWDVLDDSQQAADGQGILNGTPITGTSLGVGASPCWSAANNYSYEADVTGDVTGNGTYSLTGFSSADTNGADPWTVGSNVPQLEGATLVVVYQNAASPLTHVDVAGGSTEVPDTPTATGTFGGFTVASSPAASTTFIVADGQGEADGPATFNGNALSPGDFQGLDPMDVPSYSDGNLWDTSTYDVSSDMAAGDTAATATINGSADCLVWVGQVLSATTTSTAMSPVLSGTINVPGGSSGTDSSLRASGLTRRPSGSASRGAENGAAIPTRGAARVVGGRGRRGRKLQGASQ